MKLYSKLVVGLLLLTSYIFSYALPMDNPQIWDVTNGPWGGKWIQTSGSPQTSMIFYADESYGQFHANFNVKIYMNGNHVYGTRIPGNYCTYDGSLSDNYITGTETCPGTGVVPWTAVVVQKFKTNK